MLSSHATAANVTKGDQPADEYALLAAAVLAALCVWCVSLFCGWLACALLCAALACVRGTSLLCARFAWLLCSGVSVVALLRLAGSGSCQAGHSRAPTYRGYDTPTPAIPTGT